MNSEIKCAWLQQTKLRRQLKYTTVCKHDCVKASKLSKIKTAVSCQLQSTQIFLNPLTTAFKSNDSYFYDYACMQITSRVNVWAWFEKIVKLSCSLGAVVHSLPRVLTCSLGAGIHSLPRVITCSLGLWFTPYQGCLPVTLGQWFTPYHGCLPVPWGSGSLLTNGAYLFPWGSDSLVAKGKAGYNLRLETWTFSTKCSILILHEYLHHIPPSLSQKMPASLIKIKCSTNTYTVSFLEHERWFDGCCEQLTVLFYKVQISSGTKLLRSNIKSLKVHKLLKSHSV